MKDFAGMPEEHELISRKMKKIRDTNAHIHTPYSFSAFTDLEQPFKMAREEHVDVLGINDFNTVKGYGEFFGFAQKYHVFPLFNIEFIALLAEEQRKGILVNDPNNPGRIYFSGKGLRYPFVPPPDKEHFLEDLVASGNEQVRRMVEKVNQHLGQTVPGLQISFDRIRKELARELVRERHVARAIRLAVTGKYPGEQEQITVYTQIFNGQAPDTPPDDPAKLENEIRSRLLKKGGPAFIPEDSDAFLPVETVRQFILESGGIPCYPVLLDNAKGEITDFEYPVEKLADTLESMGVHAVEFIPGRNDCNVLAGYVEYLYRRGFLVLFGTEHNTPEMIPMKVSCRHDTPLSASLREISWRSSCVVAAHQYLVARGETGFCRKNGSCRTEEMDYLADLGSAVIGYFLNID